MPLPGPLDVSARAAVYSTSNNALMGLVITGSFSEFSTVYGLITMYNLPQMHYSEVSMDQAANRGHPSSLSDLPCLTAILRPAPFQGLQ